MKYDLVIAIDPDVDKSGIAILQTCDKTITLASHTFPDLIDWIPVVAKFPPESSHIILVEARWAINTANYHKGYYDKKGVFHKNSERVNESIATNNGRNHETGRKIIEMLKHKGLNVVEQIPLKKTWKGKDGKISHAELSRFMKIKNKTNQEERDAALIAWIYAGLPIKM